MNNKQLNNTITLIEQGSQHPTLIPSQDSVPAVLLLVIFPQGAGLGLSDDMIPDLVRTSPSARQVLVFLMLDRIWIPQAHRINTVALHLGVFQGIVIFLREALWIKSIEESNDKLY